jgi:hypothetical protein
MVTVEWEDLPVLSQHHDFFGAVCSILDHARALEVLYDQPTTFDSQVRDQSLLNRAASRNKLYYPSDLHISEQSLSLNDVEYSSRDAPDHDTAKRVAYRTSWSIWNARPPLDCSLPNLWDLMSSWDSVGPASNEVSLRYSRYWLEFDAAHDWFVIYDLCRRAKNEDVRKSRIKLSFCLSAAAYSKSKYSNTVPFFIAFALDECYRYLSPPSDLSYTASDGVAPKFGYLKDLVSQYALPMESIPEHFLKLEAKKLKSRKKKYKEAIGMQSLAIASSISSRWPDYGSVVFPDQWFYEHECRQRIEKYAQSISRNILLREHVLQLQNNLQHHASEGVSIPATLPYQFSPRFVTRPTASSYSIRDALLSRPNVPSPFKLSGQPFLGDSITPASATARTPEPVDSDSLEIIIEELQHSQQPLLELYGNELNRSYRELIGQTASQSARVAVPSHELLHLYHNDCSHKKDELFSEILATLAPSQNVEKVNVIAGLWPRITPRSLLRQLAQDRIRTLPDNWKAVIIRYAICLFKYQQSRRLLELSSSQKHDELLRETDSMRSDILAESTPDWLLVQVRPIRFRRGRL